MACSPDCSCDLKQITMYHLIKLPPNQPYGVLMGIAVHRHDNFTQWNFQVKDLHNSDLKKVSFGPTVAEHIKEL